MKTKSFLIAALMIGAGASYAQQVEIDDMYFTSQDRAALNSTKPLPTIKNNDEVDAMEAKTTEINPTDSYSGRGTNPEYTAQTSANSKGGKTNLGYFSNSYQPKPISTNLAYQPTGLNNLYNYNNYGYNGYNNYMNPYNSFYSPYYGMGMSPYYGLGLSSMYGWGGYSSYGMGYGFGYPYSNFYGNNYYGYSPYGGYGYNYYPTTVVVINNDGGNGYVHGKRGVRGGSDTYYNGNRTRGSIVANNTNGSTGGRVDSNQYYDRSWRNSIPTTQSQTRSYYGNSSGYSGAQNTRSSWDGGNGQSSFGNSRSSYNYGNSAGSFGGGGHSSGFSGGGGSSSGGGGGGRSRH